MYEKVEGSVKIVSVYIRLKMKFIKKKKNYMYCTVYELVLTLELRNGIGLDNLLLPGGKALPWEKDFLEEGLSKN